jgi:hypothetical protein
MTGAADLKLLQGLPQIRIRNFESMSGTHELRRGASEVGTGSRKENASKQKSRASVLIQSEPIGL